MSKRIIKKVAVLGSGVMGSRIACHFAGVGLQVLLLDIVPKDVSKDAKPAERNKIVNDALTAAIKSNPSPVYTKDVVKKITTGNFEDNMKDIANCDWVIEVVVERLDIKKIVFDQVEQHRKPGTLITSNTSGIPIHMMAEGRSDDFKKHFCGTHFFNPPRYLRLLEIIPTPHTDPEVVDFLMNYGDLYLGKTTVLCKDTPAFIANRVGVFGMMAIMNVKEKLKLSIDEIDALTGPIIGRPKSATFRTADVVGIDTLVKVAKGVADNCPNDEAIDQFNIPAWLDKMVANNWLGDKTGQGFFKKTKNEKGEINVTVLESFLSKWEKSFDWEYGGYAKAPKFMMPSNYQFLLQYSFLTQNEKLVEYVNLTLTKMAFGGIFDTIDGGFSRYSVDVKWHAPHFEKMTYDNGQLLSLYANAYKLTKNELYKEIIEKTTTFIEKEWFTNLGGFYSALDADSNNQENQLEEGAFYVWTTEELKNLINDDYELFCLVFNINDFGHWENGNYVLIQKESLAVISGEQNISLDQLKLKKKNWEKTLYHYREKRAKPRLDDKCLTSWNAIMLKGFVESFKALENENYLKIAKKNAHFILEKLWSSDGNLFHSYKNEKATINGFLEDYAFVIDAFIALYEATFEETWLEHAKNLTNYCLDHFYDETKQLFRFTSDLDESLIVAHFETEDNVIPASNSVMAENLFKLSVYFENSYYEKVARLMLEQVLPSIDYPSFYIFFRF